VLPMNKKRIAIAMSGGVDSSVAALLLKEEGHDVFGVTAKTWPDGSRCCSDEDILGARNMADGIGIPHHIIDLSEPFDSMVVDYFVNEYANGRTPSPCAICNREIKFGLLLEKALQLGASYMATGHYARISRDADGLCHLYTGLDHTKDQSYFLFSLSQHQLRHTLFPLAELTKNEVRTLAAEHDLPAPVNSESQDLCFVLEGEHWMLTEKRCPAVKRPGKIITVEGRIIGEHHGLHHFTIGQRKGLGIATGKRQYVVALDTKQNRVIIGSKEDLLLGEIDVSNVQWISEASSIPHTRLLVKIRYAHTPAPATIKQHADQSVTVTFDTPQSAITPGQAAVFYNDTEVMGGGWIRSATT